MTHLLSGSLSRRRANIAVGLCAAGFILAGVSQVSAQTIPPNAKSTCPVPSTDFAGWFASGTPSANGAVNPANSWQFSPANNCNFYKWSEQMFLWLNSPSPAEYGGAGRVFQSNAFYQVVPGPTGPDGKTTLKFLPNSPNGPLGLNLRAAQVGPDGLQLIFDNHHVPHEILPTPVDARGRQLIRNSAGKLVPIAKAKFGANGRPMFLDATGKTIRPQLRALAATAPNAPSLVEQFSVQGKPVFLDQFGNPIVPDQGQAGGGGVLLAQNGSLVYYATFVNDVYAWYLTQIKVTNGGTTPAGTQFPTTEDGMKNIVAYALAHGAKPFPDPNALAIEVKTSWVELNGLDPSKFIVIQGRVPVYNKSNPTSWTMTTNTSVVPLGLLGMHVVGSVTNHPEMIWATFEHFGDTPNAAYDYIDSNGNPAHVDQDTGGSWLFCKTNCSGPFNTELAKTSGTSIVSATTPASAILPSDTIRWKAWGASIDKAPNPLVTTAGESNTEVISIDNSVLSQLLTGDIRKNYFFIGATWTNSGAVPNGAYAAPPPNNLTEIGTSQLANTTMETYQQSSSNTYDVSTNCMLCHNKNTVQVSHLWTKLIPLFPGP